LIKKTKNQNYKLKYWESTLKYKKNVELKGKIKKKNQIHKKFQKKKQTKKTNFQRTQWW